MFVNSLEGGDGIIASVCRQKVEKDKADLSVMGGIGR